MAAAYPMQGPYPAGRYYSITTADNGKVLGFPLPTTIAGTTNSFTGASAQLQLRDGSGRLYVRALVWNPTTNQWEYAVVAGEFPVGRMFCMVAVTFPNSVGPILSSEVYFDVISAD